MQYNFNINHHSITNPKNHTIMPTLINLQDKPDAETFAQALINNKLFFAWCTDRYKDQDKYASEADLIISSYGVLFFFKFQDSYKNNL